MEESQLLPARMVNEFAYCPRLFYLEWVQGEFRHSADTVEGRFTHRRVDVEEGDLAAPAHADEEGGRPQVARSLMLSAPQAGIIAKIDLVEAQGSRATPVDYKVGKTPDHLPERAWEADRVQVCAQAIVLRENGYTCDEGVLYYAGSKERVPVPVDAALVERTLALANEARGVASEGRIPDPLVDSPKCPRCSLVGICLPDEVTYLRRIEEGHEAAPEVRRLLPARDDALPVYVTTQGLTVAKDGETLEVRDGKERVQSVRLLDVSQLSLFGNVQVTTQTMNTLLDREIPVCFHSHSGWFHGVAHGMTHKNVELRRRQFAVAEDPAKSLAIAKQIVQGKIRNCRTLLRRNHPDPPAAALAEMSRLADVAEVAPDAETLLGLEGAAARTYFSHLSAMLRPPAAGMEREFDFDGRNRRPPKDPVNGLLSYLYAVLVKDLTVTVLAVGFDPYLGFYHRPRYGRPALALDLMEEFRPLIGDSTVFTLVNTGEVRPDDFLRRGGAVALKERARKKVFEAYERRMDSLVTHPTFGYAISYRRVLEVQARLLARHLAGEIPAYPPFCTR